MAYIRQIQKFSQTLSVSLRRRYSGVDNPCVFSDEVQSAKLEGKPIVALESTIITHGMPYPQNIETALQVEDIIRERGAIPATIAILSGQLTVGLAKDQIEYLGQAKGVVKASRRDLAPIAAAKLDGATTVAGTIIAAELADIPIFVTGGIGGVHRQGESSLDISADLNELGRSKTLVVCAGVKSILDIGRTLEYLETQGVSVCSFGESSEFPAFYTRGSGHLAPRRVQDAAEAARMLLAAHRLRLASGIVVAVPVPQEHAMDESVIEEAISKSLAEAEARGIRGKEVTPFILSAVAQATGGASLNTNIALIKNNARVGADIAVEFRKLKNVNNSENGFNIGLAKGTHTSNLVKRFHTSSVSRARGDDAPVFQGHDSGDVLVIGGANVDRTYRLKDTNVQLDGSTHACTTEQCGGGVGRNMAEALWRLRGGRTRLLTAIGDDADGHYLEKIAPGLLLDGCVMKDRRTPSYAAVLDAKGECLLGLGDMDLHNHITVDMVDKHMKVLEKAPLVVLDGNVPQETIDHILTICSRLQKPVFFEPTDRRKASRILHQTNVINYASPNLLELQAMAQFLNSSVVKKPYKDKNDVRSILEQSAIVSRVIKFLIITLGSKGVITVKNTAKDSQTVRFYEVVPMANVENVSGAGDCFASGFINGMLEGFTEEQCMSMAFETAKKALLSKNTVPLDLKPIDLSSCPRLTYSIPNAK